MDVNAFDYWSDRIHGCLLGTAIGDALGLPYEGLSPRRARRMLGPPDRYRFCFGRGMVSDDTDHAIMTAIALLQSITPPLTKSSVTASVFDLSQFECELARQLKWWLASIPAGVGLATLRSILKLWMGWSPANSGVFSAGNGPAMRAPILGAMIDDVNVLKAFVRCSTRITHSDPKAEYGALVVAFAAHLAARDLQITGRGFLDVISEHVPSDADELMTLLTRCVESVESGQTTQEFAKSLGLANGVTGYMYHTVPVCIHAWLSFPEDFESAIRCVIECGGDADTTAAVVGGILGASVGAEATPTTFKAKLLDGRLESDVIAHLLTIPVKLPTRSLLNDYWCIRLLRNILVFLPIVLFHGFRRLFPPY